MKTLFPRRFGSVLCGVFALGGCSSLPRDQQGWTSQIQRERVLVAGFSRPTKDDEPIFAQEKAVLQKLARRLGARLQMREGNAHSLLDDVENRRLAIVVAQIRSDSPFAEKLGFSQAFYTRNDKIEYSIAVAPGENRLLLLLDQIIADERKGESR